MTTERIVDRLDSVFDLRIHRALNLSGLVDFFDHVYAHGIAYEEKSNLTYCKKESNSFQSPKLVPTRRAHSIQE
jgi:hypothetical protein